MENLLSWDYLATDFGAVSMVTAISAFTKKLGFVNKIGIELWNLLLSLAVIYPTLYFTGALNLRSAVLAVFKAFIVALASTGGFDIIEKIKPKILPNSDKNK